MHYHEAAAFLFDLRRFSVKPGTERVSALLDRLGNPEDAVSFVQVAGSNGKGSTARMTESILREAGLSPTLRLHPPRGGHDGVKHPVIEGGELGRHSTDDIDSLLEAMR